MDGEGGLGDWEIGDFLSLFSLLNFLSLLVYVVRLVEEEMGEEERGDWDFHSFFPYLIYFFVWELLFAFIYCILL